VTEPLRDLHAVDPRIMVDSIDAQASWRRAVAGWARAASSRLAGPARLLPGVAAAGCAVAGAWLLWSLGVALLVAAGLLLLVDARTPRGDA
jgi:hypothetical protein